MRYWLWVNSPNNWMVFRQLVLWGVDERYEVTMDRSVQEGDAFVFYTTETSELVATAEAASRFFRDPASMGWTQGRPPNPVLLPIRVKLRRMREAVRHPSLKDRAVRERLVFVTDKSKSWYNLMNGSMLLLSEHDYRECLVMMELAQTS